MVCVYPADCTDFSTNGNGTSYSRITAVAPGATLEFPEVQRNPDL